MEISWLRFAYLCEGPAKRRAASRGKRFPPCQEEKDTKVASADLEAKAKEGSVDIYGKENPKSGI